MWSFSKQIDQKNKVTSRKCVDRATKPRQKQHEDGRALKLEVKKSCCSYNFNTSVHLLYSANAATLIKKEPCNNFKDQEHEILQEG